MSLDLKSDVDVIGDDNEIEILKLEINIKYFETLTISVVKCNDLSTIKFKNLQIYHIPFKKTKLVDFY